MTGLMVTEVYLEYDHDHTPGFCPICQQAYWMDQADPAHNHFLMYEEEARTSNEGNIQLAVQCADCGL